MFYLLETDTVNIILIYLNNEKGSAKSIPINPASPSNKSRNFKATDFKTIFVICDYHPQVGNTPLKNMQWKK